MYYNIKRHGRVVEAHEHLPTAIRALWILTAQELQHGRVGDYELYSRLELNSLQSLHQLPPPRRSQIPDWVADVLAEHGLLADEKPQAYSQFPEIGE